MSGICGGRLEPGLSERVLLVAVDEQCLFDHLWCDHHVQPQGIALLPFLVVRSRARETNTKSRIEVGDKGGQSPPPLGINRVARLDQSRELRGPCSLSPTGLSTRRLPATGVPQFSSIASESVKLDGTLCFLFFFFYFFYSR